MPRTLALAVLIGTLSGCVSQRQFSDYRATVTGQAVLIDSLRQENAYLHKRYASILDTLTFYDDIDSGRFYRRIGSLNARINQLEYHLAVSRDGGLTVATIPVDALFEPGTAALSDQGKERLAEVAVQLREKHDGAMVRVEGHSDSVPLGPGLLDKYPSNWELSTARAAAAARFLITEQELEEDRFEVAGFGAARPVASNATAQGRAQNRRIRIAAAPQPDSAVAVTE